MKVFWLAIAVVLLASTPGAMESYLAWHEFPETRTAIVLWYILIVFVALAVVSEVGTVVA